MLQFGKFKSPELRAYSYILKLQLCLLLTSTYYFNPKQTLLSCSQQTGDPTDPRPERVQASPDGLARQRDLRHERADAEPDDLGGEDDHGLGGRGQQRTAVGQGPGVTQGG